jgi:hypothetical protein
MGAGTVTISAQSGSGPGYTLTVDSTSGSAVADYVSDGAGKLYRITVVTDSTHWDVYDDVEPDGPVGTPTTGAGTFFTPTTSLKLSQAPDGANEWGEILRRDLRKLDDDVVTSSGLTVSHVTGSSSQASATTTDIQATGMTITPGAGDYVILASGMWSGGTGDDYVTMSIYVNGVQISTSERKQEIRNGKGCAVNVFQWKTSVLAAQAIDWRWRTTNGKTLTLTNRNLIVAKVS